MSRLQPARTTSAPSIGRNKAPGGFTAWEEVCWGEDANGRGGMSLELEGRSPPVHLPSGPEQALEPGRRDISADSPAQPMLFFTQREKAISYY